MYCGLQIRNFYLILFVLIAHALLLVGSFIPYSSRGLKLPSELMIMDLRDSDQGSSLQRKSAITLQASTSNTSSTSIQSDSPGKQASLPFAQDALIPGAISRQKIDGSKPTYPLISRRLKQEGVVLVKLCVNPRGTVEKVDVLRSSGYPSLDNSALNALAKWKFASSADSFDSNAVDCFRLPVQFTLEA